MKTTRAGLSAFCVSSDARRNFLLRLDARDEKISLPPGSRVSSKVRGHPMDSNEKSKKRTKQKKIKRDGKIAWESSVTRLPRCQPIAARQAKSLRSIFWSRALCAAFNSLSRSDDGRKRILRGYLPAANGKT